MVDRPRIRDGHWLAQLPRGTARREYLAFLLILTVAYGVFAYIGLTWAVFRGAGSPVWPAAGIGLAGLLIGGVRFWPAIIIGRVAAGVLSGSGQPLWADIAIGGANVLGTVIPVLLIRRWGELDPRFPSIQDVMRYLFAGAGVGALISAAFGVLTLMFSSGLALAQVPLLFTNWAVGNFAGAVTLGPLVLSWSDRSRPLRWPQRLHLLGLVAVAALLTMLVFATPANEALRTWHLLPVLVWAALVFNVRGASLALFVVSAIAVWATSLGLGPFSNLSAVVIDRVPLVQQFIAVTAITTLLLATSADERRAKEALRAREERLRSAIEASGAGTFRWRLDRDELQCDAALTQLIGAAPGESPKDLTALVEHFHPDDRTAALRAFDACLRRGADFTLSARLGPGHGPVRILQGQGRLMSDGQGLPDYITGAFVDVTERWRLEQRLLKAEETYRAVFEQAGVGVARLTLDGVILELNDQFCEITGQPLKALLGGDWRSLAYVDDRAATEAQMALLLADDAKTSRIEKRYRHIGGEIVWVDESLALVRDQKGTPAFFLAIVQDVRERKLAEEQVRLRANELEAVLHAVPAAIWFAHDPDCRQVTGNSFSAQILRLPKPETNMSKTGPDTKSVDHFKVYDRDGIEIAPPDLPVQRAARGEAIRNFEERVTFGDGSSLFLLGNATPLHDAQGKVRGAVAAFIDITERKRSEARERLLSREVDHRAKNVLAVVQAIVQLTQAESVTSFRRTIAGRIQSLARTHNLLAENKWEGVELHRLVSDEIAPFGLNEVDQLDPRRFAVDGPMVRLKPAAAQALALVVHELVTNAVKYGALSSMTGTVDIRWALEGEGDDDFLVFHWIERDGPAIGPPGTSGFGWTVIRTSVEDQLNGDISADWSPDGLRVEMRAPLDEVTDALPSSGPLLA